MTSLAPVSRKSVNSTHRRRMSSLGEGALSRRESIFSDTGQSVVTDGGAEENPALLGLVFPLDRILESIKQTYNSKTQIKKGQYEKIPEHISTMKSKIIDFLLPLANRPHTREDEGVAYPPPNSQPSYAEITKTTAPKRNNSTVVLKTQLKSKPEPQTVLGYEESVTASLMKNNIKATIHATLPTRNGDIVMKFDKNDDIPAITKSIGQHLDVKTYGRRPLLPKIRITHIPSYMSDDKDELKKIIIDSNEWLNTETNSFEVLFTYKARDLISAVCRVSPEIRHRLLQQDKKIRVGMRSCPVVDRIHLTRCGKCQRYGHKTAVCKFEQFTCSWCSGQHKTSNCTESGNLSAHRCANCLNNEELHVSHASHSTTCHTFQKERQRVINKTDWGEDPPPL